MKSRLKILLIAEAANPEWVSVPLVGWSLSNALRKYANVHIVTQVRNRAAFLRAGLVEGQDFTAIDSEKVAGPAYRFAKFIRGGEGLGWTTISAISSLTYPYFEWKLWQCFGNSIKSGHFDVVHRITPLSPTTPSPIAKKCFLAGVPFVIGPLNGGLPWPVNFESARIKEREWLSYVRSFYRLIPFRMSTLASSKIIIVGSRHTESEIPKKFRSKVRYIPENGLDEKRFSMDAEIGGDLLRLCFIGRLVPYKGPDMALRAAIPLLKAKLAHFDFLGNGPMEDELKDLVIKEGIESHVTFHGWVPHDKIECIAGKSEIFVFPSIREFGGGAVLEAMALGLVPIVVNYGGPGELVSMGGGISISLGTRDEIIHNFRSNIEYLFDNRDQIITISSKVKEWALNNMTWDNKAKQIFDIYEDLFL